jgi:hypothetical protein
MNWSPDEEIPKFPEEYKEMNKSLSKRQIELLDGAEIKSHEGMIFGGMYADWKHRRGFDESADEGEG